MTTCPICGQGIMQVFGTKRTRKCHKGKCERRWYYLTVEKKKP